MENTVLDYCLVRERSPDEFEAKVKELIKSGFVPQGGASFGAEYGNGRMFYQAMVKFNDQVLLRGGFTISGLDLLAHLRHNVPTRITSKKLDDLPESHE